MRLYVSYALLLIHMRTRRPLDFPDGERDLLATADVSRDLLIGAMIGR